MSRYDADDVYCIPGTAVLKNKAGITDQDQLDEYEGDFTAIRLLELTQNPVEGSFDLAHLCKIHQYLFQDVYEWATSADFSSLFLAVARALTCSTGRNLARSGAKKDQNFDIGHLK